MIRTPNGKYAITEFNSKEKFKYNFTKEEYVVKAVIDAKKRAEKEIEYTNSRGNEELSDLWSKIVRYFNSDERESILKELGFDDVSLVMKNTKIRVYSNGFSSHDCCSYGNCPVCGESVNSWQDSCPKCNQGITFR